MPFLCQQHVYCRGWGLSDLLVADCGVPYLPNIPSLPHLQ
jgi:hypothetical protein